MKVLKVGIQGAGGVSEEHIKAFLKNPQTEVVHINSLTEKSSLDKVKKYALKDVDITTDYQKLIGNDEVDLISISTPSHLHPEETIAAAQAGKHVMISKPASLNHSDLIRMSEEVSSAGVKSLVGFPLRWNPLVRTLKSLVTDGTFGDIFYSEVDYLHHLDEHHTGYEWAIEKDKGGSTFLFGGCHAVDSMRWLTSSGEESTKDIVEVDAYFGGYRNEYNYPGLGVAIVVFEDGTLGKVTSNFDCAMPYQYPVRLFGSKGTSLSHLVWSNKLFRQEWVDITHDSFLTVSVNAPTYPFQGQVDHFAECILKDRASHSDLENAINTHEVCYAVEISAKERRRIELPLKI